jgi:hypothetical protein
MLKKNQHYILFLIILVVYCLFVETTMMRTTGDERVYISQALEMSSKGYWFTQILGDQGSYYKGPLHYVLLQIGFIIFGQHSMWSLLYMNIIYLLLSSYLIFSLTKKYYGEKWGIFCGLSLLLSAGLHSHAFSTQMENEVVCLFTIFIYLLDKSGSGSGSGSGKNIFTNILLWTVIGVAGWSKSPVYSALLVFSVLFFWLLKKELTKRLTSINTYYFLAFGIFIGCLGFLPAAFLDWDNFYNTYIQREHLTNKGSTGKLVSYSLMHFLINIFFPWGLFLILALGKWFKELFSSKMKFNFSGVSENNLLCCVIALSFPITVFFSLHPYRMANYLMPLVPAASIVLMMLWKQKKYIRCIKFFQTLTLILAGLIPVLMTVGYIWFYSNMQWLPLWFLVSLWSLYIIMLLLHSYYNNQHKWLWPLTLAPLFISFNLILCVFAKFEFRDLKNYISKTNNSQLYYYNLNNNIWNEWGLLNFLIGHKFLPIDNKKVFNQVISEKKQIIFPDKETLDLTLKTIKKIHPEYKIKIREWNRWKTRGKTKEGKYMWIESIRKKDLTLLSRNSYIIDLI